MRDQTKREEIDRIFVESFRKRAKERLEIFRLVKDVLLVVPSVDRVIDLPRLIGAFGPRHRIFLLAIHVRQRPRIPT